MKTILIIFIVSNLLVILWAARNYFNSENCEKQTPSDFNKNKISKDMNSTHSIEAANNTIENIPSIEERRNKTGNDPKYIQWCKDLKVSQLYMSKALPDTDDMG